MTRVRIPDPQKEETGQDPDKEVTKKRERERDLSPSLSLSLFTPLTSPPSLHTLSSHLVRIPSRLLLLRLWDPDTCHKV